MKPGFDLLPAVDEEDAMDQNRERCTRIRLIVSGHWILSTDLSALRAQVGIAILLRAFDEEDARRNRFSSHGRKSRKMYWDMHDCSWVYLLSENFVNL